MEGPISCLWVLTRFGPSGTGHHKIMNDLVDIGLLVLGPFATMSALLYVLARIEPQIDS